MTISVDIADRLYDYTDEEKAAEAVAAFQVERGLDDDTIIILWKNDRDPVRADLERRIFEAVDSNGSVTRARDSVPDGIELAIASE